MNVKITKEQHLELCKLDFKEYEFGSHLHGIATEDSDEDYIRVISDDFYDNFKTLAIYLPNIHSFQFDNTENKIQYVWMTERQFYQNLFSGDGNMVADVVLLSGEFENPLFLCQNYRVIKGYLGVAKRDLKIHKDNEKKRFHALRSLFMAKQLMRGVLPTVNSIKRLKTLDLPKKEVLWEQEASLRIELNRMLDANEISYYPKFIESDSLVNTMLSANSIREFKY